MTLRVAINGLGRIGRCIVRAAAESGRRDIAIVAANGPTAIEEHVHLLKYDSVHGACPLPVKADEHHITIGSLPAFPVYAERDPQQLPWKALQVDVVLECSGRFTKQTDAAQHLIAGARRVIVSAPCEGADATIVCGVNDAALRAEHQVISIGSCTTNCLAPIAKTLHEAVGINKGFVTTVHAYTSDQNLLDGSHKDKRRARAAALSMVPTSTGAAKAIGLVLPALAGRLAGAAIRVPVANVSMIDFTFLTEQHISKEAINALLEKAANGALRGILAVSHELLVSSDFNHTPHSATADLLETAVIDQQFGRVVAWYDNEWGFSLRMLDAAALFQNKL